VITGTVNADREPVVRIRVHDVNGQEHERAAIVDTGFTGWLTLPLDFITALGLPRKELGAAILADGSNCLAKWRSGPRPACLAGEKVFLAKERIFLGFPGPCRLVRKVKECLRQRAGTRQKTRSPAGQAGRGPNAMM
jgi:hypothetical protein